MVCGMAGRATLSSSTTALVRSSIYSASSQPTDIHGTILVQSKLDPTLRFCRVFENMKCVFLILQHKVPQILFLHTLAYCWLFIDKLWHLLNKFRHTVSISEQDLDPQRYDETGTRTTSYIFI
jgi:hypothetical protein